MTSEIVVMNHHGAAMAADSLAANDLGKVFYTANKIFQLSYGNPVGIMVYGVSEFLGIPWEILVKKFQEEFKGEDERELKDYADKFMKFLSSKVIPKENCDDFIGIFAKKKSTELRKQIQDCLAKALQKKVREKSEAAEGRLIEDEELTIEESTALAKDVIQEWITAGSDLVIGRNDKKFVESEEMGKSHQIEIIEKIFSTMMEKFSFGDVMLNKISEHVFDSLMILRRDDASAGVVICGYGADDLYPAVFSFKLRGRIGNVLLTIGENLSATNLVKKQYVLAFANDVAISSFINGISPSLMSKVLDSANDTKEKIDALLIEIGVEITEDIESKISTLVGEIRKTARKNITDLALERRQKIGNIVFPMPLDDVADTAKKMIELSIFNEKVSSNKELVGGPIDVAVISKQDGFVWKERKSIARNEE